MQDYTITCSMIKKSIFKLSNTKPLEKIKVKDILECAKIPKSSFYYNYHSLDDVIEEIMDDFVVELYKHTYRGPNIPNYIDGDVSLAITLFIEDNLHFICQLFQSHHQVFLINKLEKVFERLILNRFYKEHLIPGKQLTTTAYTLAYGFVCGWAQSICSSNPYSTAQLLYALEHIMINYMHTVKKSPNRY